MADPSNVISPAGMFTWSDIVKLSVPLAVSLFLIWVRLKYHSWRERKDKQKALWYGLSAPALHLPEAIKQLEDLVNEYECDRVRIIQFDIPETLSLFANRLAELDPKNALDYSNYVSYASIARLGFNLLNEYVKNIICVPNPDMGILKIAIRAQVDSLKKDLITLAEKELAVLRVLESTDKDYKLDTIKTVESAIENVKNIVKESKWTDPER